MPLEIAIDLVVVSRYNDPPAPDIVSKAIAAAGLGDAVWRYPSIAELATTPGRQKLGLYEAPVKDTAASAVITVYQYEKAMTAGMDETSLATLTRGLGPNDTRTLREGRLAYSMRLTTPQPQVMPALNWAMLMLRSLIDLTEGVVVDPAAQRCC